jgi:hypothetical protein
MAVLLAVAAFVFAPATAWAVGGEKATRYHVDFVLREDGSVDVTETITWQFPSGESRHGIERYVKIRAGYQDSASTYREYPISEVSASSPTGAPADTRVIDENGVYAKIRVGRADETVQGTQTYVVRYHLGAVMNGFSDHAEFYYDLLDPSNNQLYENVTASVTGPSPVDKVDCFIGERGSTQHCQGTTGATATFSAGTVQPRSGVSILASLPLQGFGTLAPQLHRGAVSPDGQVTTSEGSKALGALALGTGITLPLLAAGLMGVLVWTRGRDEQYAGLTPGLTPGVGQQATVVRGPTPTVAVQFTPPEGVQPGLVGTVIDETANTVDVAATLVDLAVRGHLRIEQIGGGGLVHRKDWRLTRTEPTPEQARIPLRIYEAELLAGVFSDGRQVVDLSDLKNRFKPTLTKVQAQMYDEVVQRGWFRRSPQAQRGTWQGLGFFIVAAGFVSLFWLHEPLSRIASGAGLPFSPSYALSVGAIVAGVITMVLGRRMAARTAEGSAVLAQSKGFKQYLVTAEAGQIRWEEAQDVFSRYLPYAIVFGVASQWAATFQQVAAAAAAAGHPLVMPVWYLGGDYGSFSGIADGMDSFASTAGSTFTSTPGSSGGSGFSAGGGFSGGGGGGGGGGSW